MRDKEEEEEEKRGASGSSRLVTSNSLVDEK